MSKAFLFSIVSLFVFQGAKGQFYDRQWVIGAGQLITLTFNGNTFTQAYLHGGNLNTIIINASSNVSDSDGNLLFYCNGNQIGDTTGNTMQGGDTLMDSLIAVDFAGGFVEPQTNIILPRSNNTFYVFNMSISDSLYASHTLDEPDRLYYSIVDMNANNGLGRVISKKRLAHKGLIGQSRLTACRHANGRDWWLVHQGYANDEYFIYLVTPDSVYAPRIQHIGPGSFYDDNPGAASAFSPDGTKFATSTARGPFLIMDFDRCNGLFRNPDSINILPETFHYNGILWGGVSGAEGCCFSPSGRFVYMTNGISITQYDTWSTNVANSAIKVGQWDSIGPANGYYAFTQMHLLPNGKIIICNFAGNSSYFHMIDSPDVQGAGCHFVFNELLTSTLNATALPNMINYRLGALAGSGCDTLTGINDIAIGKIGIKIFPNPADDHIIISLSQYHPSAKLSIFDAMGREVYRDDYMFLDKEIDVSGFARGIYLISISSANGTETMKFVKE